MIHDAEIVDAVVDFFQELFEAIFSEPFGRDLARDRLRRGVVKRQVEEAADAASQSITRFFKNERLSVEQVRSILGGWASLRERVQLADVANINVTPESLAERLSTEMGCPAPVVLFRAADTLSGPELKLWPENFAGIPLDLEKGFSVFLSVSERIELAQILKSLSAKYYHAKVAIGLSIRANHLLAQPETHAPKRSKRIRR